MQDFEAFTGYPKSSQWDSMLRFKDQDTMIALGLSAAIQDLGGRAISEGTSAMCAAIMMAIMHGETAMQLPEVKKQALFGVFKEQFKSRKRKLLKHPEHVISLPPDPAVFRNLFPQTWAKVYSHEAPTLSRVPPSDLRQLANSFK